MRALLQNYSANRPRKPRRSGASEHAPWLALRSGHAAIKQDFLNCAPQPHQTTKPSRGWFRVVVRKLRLVLIFDLDHTGNEVTAKERTDVLGCMAGVARRAAWLPGENAKLSRATARSVSMCAPPFRSGSYPPFLSFHVRLLFLWKTEARTRGMSSSAAPLLSPHAAFWLCNPRTSVLSAPGRWS